MYNLVIKTTRNTTIHSIAVALANRKVTQVDNQAHSANEDFVLYIGGQRGLYYTESPKGLQNNDVERLYKAAQAIMA